MTNKICTIVFQVPWQTKRCEMFIMILNDVEQIQIAKAYFSVLIDGPFNVYRIYYMYVKTWFGNVNFTVLIFFLKHFLLCMCAGLKTVFLLYVSIGMYVCHFVKCHV